MKVVITGGTGFIGSRLALRCREQSHDVIVLGLENTAAEAQNASELKKNGVVVEPVSILDRESLSAHFQGVDIVYHLAAAQHEMDVPDKHFRNVNVEGTRNVLDASVNAGIKRFIHGSTIGVYGIVDGRIDEHTPCNPENIYGKTKLEGEKLVLSFARKLPVVVIRIPEVYGPGDRRLLKLFKAIQKNSFFMIGSGKNLHHLIYIEDLIQAFFLAAEKDEALGQMFLLAGEKPVSTNEMVGTVAEHLDVKGSLFSVPFWSIYLLAAIMETVLRPIGIQPPLHRRRMDFFKKNFELSWQKASDILSYKPSVSFSDGILETTRWYASMGFIKNSNLQATKNAGTESQWNENPNEHEKILPSKFEVTAKMEPFDSFWEAPDDIEKGYGKFRTFYKHNYLKHVPSDKNSKILVISCGPGYMVDLLNQNGYTDVIGIDAMPHKIFLAKMRQLNCKAARAFDFLDQNTEPFDVIFCEQEINHLTKEEILLFLKLCRDNLNTNGTLILHSLNGANPLVGSENLALNFDHYNTFTEKSLEQILEFSNFKNIIIFPLKLYVFYKNPFNYVGIFFNAVVNQFLKICFKFYGKSNNIFAKKIGVFCQK